MDNIDAEFETKLSKYLRSFGKKHPKEMMTLKAGKLLEPENKNILDHLLIAGVLGELMCDILNVKGSDKDDVISALIIHDWDKLAEKDYLREAVIRGKKVTYRDLEMYKSQHDQKLKEMGYSDRVIALTDENITHEEGGPKNLPEMIVFYVDAMLISAKIVDIPLRFQLTKDGWHGGYGRFDEDLKKSNREYSENFFKGAPGHGNKSHFDVQMETAHNVSEKFVGIIKTINVDAKDRKYQYIFGVNGDIDKLPYYFEDKLKERAIR